MADITFSCPHCNKHLLIEEAGAGVAIQCPGCGQEVVVPSRSIVSRPSAPIPPPVNTHKQPPIQTSAKKRKGIAAILAFFLGGLGIHKFYLRRYGWGLVYLMFCWTCLPIYIALVESIILLCMKTDTFNKRYNSGPSYALQWKPFSNLSLWARLTNAQRALLVILLGGVNAAFVLGLLSFAASGHVNGQSNEISTMSSDATQADYAAGVRNVKYVETHIGEKWSHQYLDVYANGVIKYHDEESTPNGYESRKETLTGRGYDSATVDQAMDAVTHGMSSMQQYRETDIVYFHKDNVNTVQESLKKYLQWDEQMKHTEHADVSADKTIGDVGRLTLVFQFTGYSSQLSVKSSGRPDVHLDSDVVSSLLQTLPKVEELYQQAVQEQKQQEDQDSAEEQRKADLKKKVDDLK